MSIQTNYILLLICLFSLSQSTSKLIINDETNITTEEKAFSSGTFNIGKMYIGSGNETSIDTSDFAFDFQQKSSIIGVSDESGWGINCYATDKESSNSCVYNPQSETNSDTYHETTYNYLNGNAFIMLDNSSKINLGKLIIFITFS